MADCDFCNKEIDGLPFKCKFCGNTFCSKHYLPEDHNCVGLKEHNKKNRDRWKNIKIKTSHKSFSRKHKRHREKTPSYVNYEMYNPKGKKHSFKFGHFNLSKFLRKYVYFRIDHKIKPHLYQFLMLFVIGIILDYVYYGTFSLHYLFIGGVKDWFNVLIPTLNGISAGYDILYLIMNGIFYFYFYRYFIGFVFTTLTRLNKRDTWVMIVWFLILICLAYKYLPNLI